MSVTSLASFEMVVIVIAGPLVGKRALAQPKVAIVSANQFVAVGFVLRTACRTQSSRTASRTAQYAAGTSHAVAIPSMMSDSIDEKTRHMCSRPSTLCSTNATMLAPSARINSTLLRPTSSGKKEHLACRSSRGSIVA